MTISEIKSRFRRKEDWNAIADLAGLDGREKALFMYRMEGGRVYEMQDTFFRGYWTLYQISSSINRKLKEIPADI